jgi:NAD(P)H-hydrate epimerase
MQPGPPAIENISELPVLPPRPADSNKGNYGRILIIAGSRGMSGAAILSASAALRSGAGLVTLAVPEEILPVVAGANPCYLTAGLPHDSDGRLAAGAESKLLSLAQLNEVVAIGPGLAQSEAIATLVQRVVTRIGTTLLIDADGLNAVQHSTECFKNRAAPLVITPHPGEFARIAGTDVRTIQSNRQEYAARFAVDHGAVVVLKGYGTLVTDGRRLYRNTTGNPGMATGGTGDVLTGMIAALLGQHLEPFAAAQLGVHVHGLAGDLARDDLGEVSVIASDLLDYLPRAFRNF